MLYGNDKSSDLARSLAPNNPTHLLRKKLILNCPDTSFLYALPLHLKYPPSPQAPKHHEPSHPSPVKQSPTSEPRQQGVKRPSPSNTNYLTHEPRIKLTSQERDRNKPQLHPGLFQSFDRRTWWCAANQMRGAAVSHMYGIPSVDGGDGALWRRRSSVSEL